MTKILLILVSLALMPGISYAKDKDTVLEQILKDEIFEEGKQKGKGGANNPGQHGRDNAAAKQAANHGKGSAKHSSESGTLLDEILGDDDERGDRKKGKGKDKKKDK